MNRLDDYFKAYNKIDEQTPHSTFEMEPAALITPRRIDILVKYYYIHARETGEDLAFAKELYEKHIEAFTDGLFQEHGNKEKNSLEKYLEIFDEMIDQFKEAGFDAKQSVIPIGRNNELLDGAHRTACALYFHATVPVMKFPDLAVDYGFDFFRRRLLDEVYLDFIAKEYVQLKGEVRAMIAWPKIGNKQNIQYIDDELERQGVQILYKKRLTLDEKTLQDLVFTIYREEHWLGFNLEKFKAVQYKANLCYDEKGYLTLYLLEDVAEEQLVDIKNHLRNYFQVEKSSIHTADTHQESVETANFLLDQNYGELLRQNYLARKDVDHTFTRFAHRKIRYYYRTALNRLKKILGKPV